MSNSSEFYVLEKTGEQIDAALKSTDQIGNKMTKIIGGNGNRILLSTSDGQARESDYPINAMPYDILISKPIYQVTLANATLVSDLIATLPEGTTEAVLLLKTDSSCEMFKKGYLISFSTIQEDSTTKYIFTQITNQSAKQVTYTAVSQQIQAGTAAYFYISSIVAQAGQNIGVYGTPIVDCQVNDGVATITFDYLKGAGVSGSYDTSTGELTLVLDELTIE